MDAQEPVSGGEAVARNCKTPAARLIAFCGLLLSGIFIGGVLPQEMGSIVDEYGLAMKEFGFLAAGMAIASALLGASAVWALPRWGAFKVCVAGFVLFGAGLVAVALVRPGWPAVALGLLLAGGLACMQHCNTLVAQVARKNAVEQTNLLHGFNSLGKAIAPPWR
jgi:hypothetical protein